MNQWFGAAGLCAALSLSACSDGGASMPGTGGAGGIGTGGAGGAGAAAGSGASPAMGGNIGSGGSSGSSMGATGGSGGTGGNGGNGGTAGATATGGAAGASGSAGMGPSVGGASGSAGGPATGSPGCGLAAEQDSAEWVEQAPMNVAGSDRRFWIWLPENYDPERPYPLVVLLHGCGSETNNVPVQNESGQDAILVRGRADRNDGCWDTSADGPNVEFFDRMVDDVAAKACIDLDRVFAAGYSSGSWLINQLTCLRADRLRAVGTVAGGSPFVRNCAGNVAQLFIHDLNDEDNSIQGSETARDRLLEANQCDASSAPVDPEPCQAYSGCLPGHSVVWCATSGRGHSRQDSLAAAAFWNFFHSF